MPTGAHYAAKLHVHMPETVRILAISLESGHEDDQLAPPFEGPMGDASVFRAEKHAARAAGLWKSLNFPRAQSAAL